jgi:UTP-glucose-1-phosphate uridylyltransferase
VVNIKTENQFLDLKAIYNKISLVILAGGLGSRYNGQKQIDAMGPNHECLMEYSIYDALSAGISDFIFVINDKFDQKTITYFKRIIEKNNATVSFVTQTVQSNVPDGFISENFNRQKPWGTAHALLVTKAYLNNPFIVINADDFYGKSAYSNAVNWINNKKISEQQYGIIAYKLFKTLSENGNVSRGICSIQNEKLLSVVERTDIYQNYEKVYYTEQDIVFEIDKNVPVSMNFWILHPSIFTYLEIKFNLFLEKNSKNLKAEFYLPQVINELIQDTKIKVIANISNESWFGVTYPADKEIVQNKLLKQVENKRYPKKLWE